MLMKMSFLLVFGLKPISSVGRMMALHQSQRISGVIIHHEGNMDVPNFNTIYLGVVTV